MHVALAIVSLALVQDGPEKSLRASPLRAATIVVDGVLDEPVWTGVAPTTDFIERAPQLRAAPPEATEIRVLVDRTAMYVGIVCRDSQPAAVAARTLTRDAFDIFADDAVSVKLDTALDRRTTLGFAMNAAGARLDYRGIQESQWQIEFDGIWDGAAKRTRDGWSAELRIPWTTLGVDPDAPPERMGFNVSRDHSRRAATYDWALLAPPFSPIAASRYGTLDGLKAALADAGGERASGWSVDVYTLGGLHGVRDADLSRQITGGVDVQAAIDRRLVALLTVNTDFAQVDLDDQVVNLTRFDLFLPEKRGFFLKAGDLFSFGSPGSAQLYYSRRIGLTDGRQVPIAAGLEVVARPAEGLQIGLLDVLTEPSGDTPWTSNLVARIQQDLAGDVVVGAMLAHRQSLEGGADRNLAVGVDGAFRGAGTPLLIQGWGMVTASGAGAADTGPTATDGSANVSASWRGELVRPSIGYAWIGDDVRSDLGYFERTAVQVVYGDLEVVPRIGKGGVETITLGFSSFVVGSESTFELLDFEAEAYARVDWDAGYYVTATGARRLDTVSQDFGIGPDTTIRAGEYGSWLGVLGAGLPGTWPVSFNASAKYGEFYGGRLSNVTGALTARAGTALRLQAGASVDFGRFDNGTRDFDSATVNARATFGFSPDLGVDVYSGFGLLADLLVLQARLRWTWRSGSDLFLVQEVDLGSRATEVLFHSLQIKLTAHWP